MPTYGSQTPNTGIQKPPAMSGRVVSQEADITPQEVPMDGSFSWFPMADGSAVIGKRWNSDGTMVFDAAYSVLGDDAVSVVPREYERMVA